LLLCATVAFAHDPDWKGDEPGDENAESETEAPEPTTVEEEWPDPFKKEREWGPVSVGIGAGAFVPWQGNAGSAVTGNVLVSSPTGHVRLGGELVYRSFESRFFDVNDVDVDSYQVSFVFHYLFNPEGFSPYLGFTTGFSVNKIRKTEVQDQQPVRVTDDVGAGLGLSALVGLELPVGEHFALYGEARIGLASQQTSTDDDEDEYGYNDSYDDYETEDIGGVTGVLGVRYRF
jgi:hypothetical protein